MRNELLHGGSAVALAGKDNVTLNALVENVGGLAWVALLDAIARVSTKREPLQLQLLRPSTVLHQRLLFIADMARPCAADQEPTFDDFPPKGLEVRLVPQERTDAHSQ